MRLTLLMLLHVCWVVAFAQGIGGISALGGVSHEGDAYFEHQKYRQALQYYRQSGTPETWSRSVMLRAAICQYEINEVDGAIGLFLQLIRESKTDPEVYYYLARCYHHKGQFAQALNAYKDFLRNERKDTPQRIWVKDELVRCSNGVRERYGPERAYVENMGAPVNSSSDDYGPVPSRNYTTRLYFTSAREDSEGGPQGENGLSDPKYGTYRSDIYYTENIDGIWHSAVSLDNVLNTRFYEELLCFSMDGQQMYFRRSSTPSGGNLVIDTFSNAVPQDNRVTALGPFNIEQGDRDLYLFNDTIMLFASNRPGGFGGFDVYCAIRRQGKWREAVNLGERINSFYDDLNPFLTRNGRVLYFSSDRLESLGGLDVFTSTFVDSLAQWEVPVNMGLPINSAGDDTGFQVAPDGLKGFMTSDRKSGFGGKDLYVVYFKEQVRENLMFSVPLTFMQFAVEKPPVKAPERTQDVREYVISNLWFEPNDLVLTPQNIRKLEVLSNMMLIYPKLTLDLICHDIPSGPRSYDLFFSVKKAEQVAEYLERKGIARNRIYTKGCGAYYPLATAPDGNNSVDRLNRRIEVHVYNTEQQPVKVSMEEPQVPKTLRDPAGIRFTELQETLVYRVQIAVTAHLFQHDVFDTQQDAMIDYDQAAKTYRYLVGMYTDYEDAVRGLETLHQQGFSDASIKAYVFGKSIGKIEARKYVDQFPDLMRFIGEE